MIREFAFHFNRSAKACDALKNLKKAKNWSCSDWYGILTPDGNQIGNAYSVSRNWAVSLPSCERPKNTSVKLAFSLLNRGAKNDRKNLGAISGFDNCDVIWD
jgi:hypothetical protein